MIWISAWLKLTQINFYFIRFFPFTILSLCRRRGGMGEIKTGKIALMNQVGRGKRPVSEIFNYIARRGWSMVVIFFRKPHWSRLACSLFRLCCFRCYAFKRQLAGISIQDKVSRKQFVNENVSCCFFGAVLAKCDNNTGSLTFLREVVSQL